MLECCLFYSFRMLEALNHLFGGVENFTFKATRSKVKSHHCRWHANDMQLDVALACNWKQLETRKYLVFLLRLLYCHSSLRFISFSIVH